MSELDGLNSIYARHGLLAVMASCYTVTHNTPINILYFLNPLATKVKYPLSHCLPLLEGGHRVIG